MNVNTNGSGSTPSDGSAQSADLTIDQKLDHIMEAVSFQTKILASALIAFDKKLQKENTKIITPNGLI